MSLTVDSRCDEYTIACVVVMCGVCLHGKQLMCVMTTQSMLFCGCCSVGEAAVDACIVATSCIPRMNAETSHVLSNGASCCI